MRHGLERYEKVLTIVDTHTADQILAYLSADGVQVNPFLQNGQLKIWTPTHLTPGAGYSIPRA